MDRNRKDSNRSWFNWRSRFHAKNSVEETGDNGEGSKGPESGPVRRFESDAEAERLKDQIKKTVKPPCPHQVAATAALILSKLGEG